MEPCARAALAHAVFNRCLELRDNFRDEHFGADLCYLLGAILDPAGDGHVDWSDWIDVEETREFFREHFAAEHPVWQFIIIEGESVCDCQRSNGPNAVCRCNSPEGWS
jgi:hypothetical protein